MEVKMYLERCQGYLDEKDKGRPTYEVNIYAVAVIVAAIIVSALVLANSHIMAVAYYALLTLSVTGLVLAVYTWWDWRRRVAH